MAGRTAVRDKRASVFYLIRAYDEGYIFTSLLIMRSFRVWQEVLESLLAELILVLIGIYFDMPLECGEIPVNTPNVVSDFCSSTVVACLRTA